MDECGICDREIWLEDYMVCLRCFRNEEAKMKRLGKLLSNPEQLARRFHEAYERLAPTVGWETREETRVKWEDVPEPNKTLMAQVAGRIAQWILQTAQGEHVEWLEKKAIIIDELDSLPGKEY